ncbi:hypothetical protein [Thiohalocapsa marina]|uniref:hypothetical protein n=1 Tax=Thiohalocapsa marina TaxID=424902 RepID=UPI0036D9F1F9
MSTTDVSSTPKIQQVHAMKDNTTTIDPTTVRLADITIDPGIQQRADGLDSATLEDYRRALDTSPAWPFPPVVAFRDGDEILLADGFHRLRAAGDCGRSEVRAEVRTGARREALLYAVAANADHGLRRTDADKRRAVETLLADPEWAERSDRWIADQCRVTHPFVGRVRKALVTVTSEDQPEADVEALVTVTSEPPAKPAPKVRKTADGRTMNTANIGKRQPQAEPQDPDAPAPTTRRRPGDPSPAVVAQQAMIDAGTAIREVTRHRETIQQHPETAPQLVRAAVAMLAWLAPLVEQEGEAHA